VRRLAFWIENSFSFQFLGPRQASVGKLWRAVANEIYNLYLTSFSEDKFHSYLQINFLFLAPPSHELRVSASLSFDKCRYAAKRISMIGHICIDMLLPCC
jgi:hypothetical protein